MKYRTIPIIQAEKLIPAGKYCYQITTIKPALEGLPPTIKKKPCFFHSISKVHPKQMNGYCSYEKRGDWEPGLSFLWDGVKECSIKTEVDD